MIRYECDKCGRALGSNDPGRYIVKLEIYAAAGHVDLDAETSRSTDAQFAEVLQQLAETNPDDVEDQTYRSFRFDVCDACRKILLANPIGRD